jgi:hypothetical protein
MSDLDAASSVLDRVVFHAARVANAIDRLSRVRWFYVRGRCVGCGERAGGEHGEWTEDSNRPCPVEVLLDFKNNVGVGGSE